MPTSPVARWWHAGRVVGLCASAHQRNWASCWPKVDRGLEASRHCRDEEADGKRGCGRVWAPQAWLSAAERGLKHPGSCPPRRLRRGQWRIGPQPISCSSSLARGPGATAGPIPALTSWFAAAQGNPACPGWSNGACRCYTRGSLRPPRGIPPSRSAQPPVALLVHVAGRQFPGARAALTGGSEASSGNARGGRATGRVGQGHTGGYSPRHRHLHRPPHASAPQMLRLRTREIVPIELRKWS